MKNVHYFTILTKDFEDIANFGLYTFSKFNDVKLNVYVLDNSNLNLKYKNINYISYNKKLKIKNFNSEYISQKSIECAIQCLSILDQNYDIFVRIDLDAIFEFPIKELVDYSESNKIGFLGAREYFRGGIERFKTDYYINCGIAVFNKEFLPKISFVEEFYKMYNQNPSFYCCPEQDFFNTFENRKSHPNLITLSSESIDLIESEAPKIIHLNGKYTKPFNKLIYFSDIVYLYINKLKRISVKTDLLKDIIEYNYNFLKKEFKKLPFERQQKILRYKWKM